MISPMKVSSYLCKSISRGFIHRRLLASASPASKLLNVETSHGEVESAKNQKWQLMVSVCLERFPLISPEPTDLEIKYYQMLRMIEDEKSLLSHHELRREEDRRVAKKAAAGKPIIQTDERQIITAQDFEDASMEELKLFTLPERMSESENKNLQSVNRLLDRKLIFVVKPPFGDKDFWDIPGGALEEGETLSQAAQRYLEENLEISPSPTFYGNAPRKLYKYKYPKPVMQKTGTVGAKMFMFKAELPPRATVVPRVNQFQWLSRDELSTAIKQSKYRRCISSFIFE